MTVLIIIMIPAWGWNSTGHQITAELAYKQLSARAKSRVDRWLKTIDPGYSPKARFVYAAMRPDVIKGHNIQAFNHWHYINKPITAGGRSHPPSHYNLLWALKQCERVIKSKQALPAEKAWALTMWMHLAGDAHQPLHCAIRFSKRFPRGDAGGNRYRIKSPAAGNLHRYWDQGLGLLVNSKGRGLSRRARYRLESRLSKLCAKNMTNSDGSGTHPEYWVKQSHKLAANFVYKTPYGRKPDQNYNRQGRQRTACQLLLAADRMASGLNNMFSSQSSGKANH